jgi:hypothetical protein
MDLPTVGFSPDRITLLAPRDTERTSAEGRNFEMDEPIDRPGFEAALRPPDPGRSYGERQAELRQLHPAVYDREEFRRGHERGVAYLRGIRELGRRDAA